MNRPTPRVDSSQTAFVVLDTETTGFPSGYAKRASCRVRGIQFGLAFFHRGKLVDTWARLVCPPVWPSAKSILGAQRIHGISVERVKREGVSALACWSALDDALAVWMGVAGLSQGELPILAWNARFDTEILVRLGMDAGVLDAATREQEALMPNVDLDLSSDATMVSAPGGCLMEAYKGWCRGTDVRPGSKSLDSARERLGLAARQGKHDATDDAVKAGEVLLAMQRGVL